MTTKIVDGVIVRERAIVQNFSFPNLPNAFTGIARSLEPKYTKQKTKDKESVIPQSTSSDYFLESDEDEEVEIIEVKQPISTKLLPYEDFELYCLKDTTRTAVVFFPNEEDPAFSFAEENFSKRMHYMTKEYNVFGKRIDTLEQATKFLTSLTQFFCYEIEHIEIGGHGTPTSISLPKETISVGNSDTELVMLFSILKPNSTILTLSCQNGKDMKNKENMLEYMARIGLGHKVIGTSCNNGKHLSLEVLSPYPLNLKYTDKKGKDVTMVYQF